MTIESRDWSLIAADEATRLLESPVEGLTPPEAEQRLLRFGPNEIDDEAGRTKLEILIEQFRAVLTYVLLAAALISLLLGDWLEATAILAIVILNAVMGYVQESKAEEAMAALQQMAVPAVTVRRGAEVTQIPSADLVLGDRVLLETGNIVPADGRLVDSANLRIEEAALTGESQPVTKRADMTLESGRAIAERRNMAYSGTTVTMGRGELLVTETGMATEIGKIASMIQSVQEDRTPLQRRLDSLGKVLALAATVLVVIIFVLGMFRGDDIETLLLTSVSLAVAAIPEAMPAVVTIALSLGAQRMLKRNALIRSLPAVETLGSVNVICTDKTGTLTENRMTAVVLDVANHHLFLDDEPPDDVLPTIELAIMTGALCNDAALTSSDSGYKAIGDPTEGALVVAGADVGLLKDELETALPRVGEVPFDSDRKRMTTIHRLPSDASTVSPILSDLSAVLADADLPSFVAFTKGAITGLVERSGRVWTGDRTVPLDGRWTARIFEAEEVLAGSGMRVLGLAVKPLDDYTDGDPDVENDLILVGMFGLIDPPREAVPGAVAASLAAGIRPVMITGDHPLTARHIAQQIGITDGDRVVIGTELDKMSDSELATTARSVDVFARVSPKHKLDLIAALQDQGDLVAMTGDGVNDAPALKKADIGVAMGITGTDVSKQAADMVLLDDNYATIVAAVEEGRVIYDNIRKFIKYLLTCNTSEILVMVIGPFLGMPLPLLPLQILWMNLVTDGLPALALGVEPAEDDVMERPPRSATETIFGGGTTMFIGVFGLAMSVITLGVGWWMWNADDPAWQSVLFTVLIFAQLGLALEVRSEKRSLFSIGLTTNMAMLGAVAIGIVAHLGILYMPFLQRVFGTVALDATHLAIATVGALVLMALVEVYKKIR
ncbi:MAG: cation-translocating P-type ATPase [Acidimicrobiia bacterium]|nr:MAG: cation-translocating P-type ATPase [Acidimicrobiia bacterium]